MQTIVNELLHQQALVKTPGRSYHFFDGFKDSFLGAVDK